MAKKTTRGREIEFTVRPNGEVDVDLLGYEGKNCVNDVKEILNALGKEKSVKKKREYYRDGKVQVSQGR